MTVLYESVGVQSRARACLVIEVCIIRVTLCFERMAWKYILILAGATLGVSFQTCPSDHFSAVVAATVDQTIGIDDLNVIFDDPEFYFFEKILKLRDEELPYVFEEAMHFSTRPLD